MRKALIIYCWLDYIKSILLLIVIWITLNNKRITVVYILVTLFYWLITSKYERCNSGCDAIYILVLLVVPLMLWLLLLCEYGCTDCFRSDFTLFMRWVLLSGWYITLFQGSTTPFLFFYYPNISAGFTAELMSFYPW